MSPNKDSVSKAHIQKESHRANLGSAFLHTVQKKGSFWMLACSLQMGCKAMASVTMDAWS